MLSVCHNHEVVLYGFPPSLAVEASFHGESAPEILFFYIGLKAAKAC